MIRITNGKLVLPDKTLDNHDVLIEGSWIKGIVPASRAADEDAEIIDACGGYVMPGFVDIHSDYIEQVAAPRPSALIDFNIAVKEAEKELLFHGITTIYHSLSLYNNAMDVKKEIRKMENVQRLTNCIKAANERQSLIRHRFHARFEIDNIDNIGLLKQYIEDGRVDLISFMNHAPGQGQYGDVEAFKSIIKDYVPDRTDEWIKAQIDQMKNRPVISDEDCRDIARLAAEKGISLASHDDDSKEKVDYYRSLGMRISEFPITLEVAQYAREMGMYTVAGAPNILLGASHAGNLAAHEAIAHGCIDILCSDYYPAGIIHAVFKLVNHYGYPMEEIVKMVTLNPAKAVNMGEQLGSIEAGKSADLLIVETLEDGFPSITACFVDGALVLRSHYVTGGDRHAAHT